MAVPVQAPSRARTASAAAVLRHPPIADFVYLVSPSEVELVDGELLPRLVRFGIVPGVMGVPAQRKPEDPVRWEGPVAEHCKRSGRTLVDPRRYDIVPKVDGKPVEPGPGEDPDDPRTWYVARFPGFKGPVHVSVWQRPRVLGSQVLWDVDKAGETDFRRQIVAKMFPDGTVDPQIADVVRFAAERELANLEAEARINPRMTHNAEVVKAALGPPQSTKPAKAGG